MTYYITYGKFQHYLKEYYIRTGSRMQFPEMISYLKRKGLLCEGCPESTPGHKMFSHMSDDEFEKILDNMVLTITPDLQLSPYVRESSIIPTERDVFIIRHPRYTRLFLHTHNYFEINFVASGSCTFYFEKESRVLNEGEFCIIAPESRHDLSISDESIVFCMMLRKSTFNTTFFSLLSQKDLLSLFFRTILQGNSRPNYLLFFVKDTDWIKTIIHNALGECHKNDSYSNISCINWMNLLFSTLLRNYSQTLQFYNYQMGSDFSLVLQYIQHNYQTLTLSSLAEFFHYSEPHLCTLIKQNTGYSFTELIRQLRMADAVSYLINTNLKVSEIAERIGYNSADHFSRVFRNAYKMSPQEYRKTQSSPQETFIPFA
ncbi:MAG: AraC family transcriptional regulator [Lachnospiraceae bacterium]|nr:AraC family transcriptional regulator [Lachnospiraceae bacterium]MDE7334610.1 AraC family transcriptional regulator [Lachnospiraceae bacterium]